jgi:hypothetical protein
MQWLSGSNQQYLDQKSDLYYPMRNTTKLKQILMKYDLALSMDEDSLLKLSLVDKLTGRVSGFENSSYSLLLSKCYSHFLKELKKETGPLTVAGKKNLIR